MPRKSKNAQQKASRIAIARSFRHSSDLPDAEMITTRSTPPETSSASPNAEIIIIDLDNDDINEGINLEGHSPLGLEGYEDEDEQGYVWEGEEFMRMMICQSWRERNWRKL